MKKDDSIKMKRHIRKGVPLVILLLVLTLTCTLSASVSREERADGLIVSKLYSTEKEDNYEYLTMILKIGYGHEPKEKHGLNNLTHELIYLLLRSTSALDVNYFSFAEYTVFTFVLWQDDFSKFCSELDAIIQLDALLLYDLCNQLIYQHYHTPETPTNTGQRILYEILYGPTHPYLNGFKADYTQLNINEVNSWFREIYKPNNIIISTTAELPEDFLKKPSGRDMEKIVSVPEVPAISAAGPAHQFTEVHAPFSTIFLSFPGPKPNTNDFFTARFIQKYLQHQLWLRLRQELGYCYDVQVNYSYLSEPTAPNITIAFQVLPENTEPALHEVFNLLEKMAKEPLPSEEIAYLVEREEKYQRKNYSTPRFLSMMDAIGVHLGITWATDYEEYSAELQKLTGDDIFRFTQTYLKNWRLSVVGPDLADLNANFMQKYRAEINK